MESECGYLGGLLRFWKNLFLVLIVDEVKTWRRFAVGLCGAATGLVAICTASVGLAMKNGYMSENMPLDVASLFIRMVALLATAAFAEGVLIALIASAVHTLYFFFPLSRQRQKREVEGRGGRS